MSIPISLTIPSLQGLLLFLDMWLVKDDLESEKAHLKFLQNHSVLTLEALPGWWSQTRQSALVTVTVTSVFWHCDASGIILTSFLPNYLWTWERNSQLYVNTDGLLQPVSWWEYVDSYHRKTNSSPEVKRTWGGGPVDLGISQLSSLHAQVLGGRLWAPSQATCKGDLKSAFLILKYLY